MIRRLSQDRFLLDFRAEGVRRRLTFRGTLKDAKRAVRAQRREAERRRFGLSHGPCPALPGLLEGFLKERAAEGRSQSYLGSLDRVLRSLVARWGPVDPRAVTREMVASWTLERERAGAAPSTRRVELSYLAALYNWAMAAGYLEATPLRGLKRPRLPRRRKRWLLPEEFHRLWQASPPALRPAEELLLVTALRLSEAVRLSPAMVRAGVLRVQRPKTQDELELPCPPALAALVLQFAGQWTYESLRSAIRRAAQGAGLAPFGPHTLRHTWASWLVTAGWTIYRVRDWLGHSEVRQTECYAHLGRLDWQEEREHLPPRTRELLDTLVLEGVA